MELALPDGLRDLPLADEADDCKVPLCVDLDGTLVRTDLLHELLLALVRQAPTAALRLPLWLLHGKAHFKRMISERAELDVATLPFNPDVLALIGRARAAERPVILVTASPKRIADAVACHLGVFDAVMSSDRKVNLSAQRKANALVGRFGAQGFDYAGNGVDDVPVWAQARHAIVVRARSGVARAAVSHGNVVLALPQSQGRSWAAAARALRPHQWLKNLLVFVPVFTAHELLDPGTFGAAARAFVAFCMCASAVYVFNDLLDLAADRRHPTKRNRPFASGALPPAAGVAIIAPLLVLAVAIAATLPPLFLAVLGAYFAATLAYSVYLKQQVIVDVMLLAGLYTLRLIAGAAATGIVLSFWLLAFSMFIFLSLALVKRYTELRLTVGANQQIAGRGYAGADLPVLMSLGASSGMIAVLVFALFIDDAATREAYPAWEWLWLVPPIMLYWVARVWMKSLRGEVHDDPVVFAAKDWQSLVAAACIVALFLAAGGALR